MKKQLLLLWALIACTSLHAQTFSNYLRDGNYFFDDTFKLQLTEIFTTYKPQFGLGTYDAMILQDEAYVKPDTSTIRKRSLQSSYKQYYKGYEVEGTCINVTSKCGVVLVANGKLRTGLDMDVDDTIPEADALDSAMQYVNPDLWFAWMDTNYVNMLQEMDTSFTGYPEGKLVIVKKFGSGYADTVINYALCWKFDLSWYDTVATASGTDTVELSKDVYVNALTGEIHTEYSSGTGAIGSLETTYDGYKANQMFTECSDIFCFTYKLRDEFRKISTVKYIGTSYTQATPQDNDNDWTEPFNRPAATCHWATERAYDYFNFRHGNWNPNWTQIFENASDAQSHGLAFSGYYYNNGDPFEKIWIKGGDYSRATLDVLGHEFTHGVIRRSTPNIGLDPNFQESEGIMEGLCDIFGMLSERYYRGWNDWTLGENLLPGFKRNFNDPENDVPDGHGATYLGTGYFIDGAYGKSGPIRRWFNHLGQGDWNWSPPYSGAGTEIADDITYITMMWWSWQTIDYSAMRHQTLAAAEHYFGKCSNVWRKVERAWDDVNVTGPNAFCKDLELHDQTVVSVTQLGLPTSLPRFRVQQLADTPVRILHCNWVLPSVWTGFFNTDSTVFTLDSAGNFNSQMVSVIVTYEKNSIVITDTLTAVTHFSDECNDEATGARHAAEGTAPGMNSVQNKINSITLFPNPVSSQLNLTMPANMAAELSIYNINGQEVFKTQVSGGYNGLPLPTLSTGIYIVRIKNDILNEVRKIQVQQ